jgi:N-acylneuraminate cytidylyltransferase
VSIHRREDILCDGHKASFSEVITGVVRDIRTPHFAWVPVVVPLMGPGDYKAAFDAYAEQVVKGGLYDSLVAVNLMKEYLWDDEGPINYKADRNHTISQDLPNIYRVTNGLYMSSTEQALKLGYFLGPNPLRFKVGKIAGIDIDEWEDYEMTLSLHSFYKGEIRI